jgi:hypothetical protein
MTLKTIPIRINLSVPDGSPAQGAIVTASLVNAATRRPDFDTEDGLLVPTVVTATADEFGSCVIALWPNERGTRATAYRVQARIGAARLVDLVVSVPDADSTIELPVEDLLTIGPFPPIDAAQQALAAAQGALANVTVQAGIATAAAADAVESEQAAASAAGAALLSAQGATSERALALQARSEASGLAATAASQAGIATAQAELAAVSSAQADADAAQTGVDRVQTGSDRTATGADRAQTALDRTQTGADRQATAADRLQTGLDRAATGADVAASGVNAEVSTAQASTSATKAAEAGAYALASQASSINSANSETSAAASAATATTQAAAATSQASNAAASAVSAAASFDAFDDRFLGAKAANPTLDNDGQALLVGAMYWNTTESAMRAWSGSEWFDTNELDGRILADQQLLGAVVYATDMALKGLDGITENRGTFGSTDRAELYAYMFGELLDKIGVIGRAISGGTIELQGGTAAIPSLTSATDVTTGVFFPANGVMALAAAGLERLRITSDGRLGLGTNAPSGLLDVADSKLRVRTAQTPASATAAGNQGEWAWDANHIYVCINTNTWRRAALTSW